MIVTGTTPAFVTADARVERLRAALQVIADGTKGADYHDKLVRWVWAYAAQALFDDDRDSELFERHGLRVGDDVTIGRATGRERGTLVRVDLEHGLAWVRNSALYDGQMCVEIDNVSVVKQ